MKQRIDDFMESAGWPAHTLCNAAQAAFDVLSIGIEVIVMKFLYFGICIVGIEQLKDFCDFVDI